MSPRPFFSNCVSWCENAPLEVLEWLCENADDIVLSDFKGRVDIYDFAQLVSDLGYAGDDEMGLKIEEDYHVAYKVERRSGVPFIVHSAIEYVFASPEDIDRIQGFIEMEADLAP